QALSLDSSSAPSWHLLAMSLAESGDYDAALLDWHRSVTVDPSYTEGLAFLALGYYWRRQYDSAMRWVDSAIATDPNYVLGRTTAGQIAVEQRNFAPGAPAFEAALRLSTDIEIPTALAGGPPGGAPGGRSPGARRLPPRGAAPAPAAAPPPPRPA